MPAQVGLPTAVPKGRMLPTENAADFVNRWYEMGPAFCITVDRGIEPGEICFSGALFAVKAGFFITRRKWREQGKYVTRQAGYPDGIPVNANTAAAAGVEQGTMCQFAPYLMLCLGGGTGGPPMFVPWTPHMLDLLAADWIVLDRPGREVSHG